MTTMRLLAFLCLLPALLHAAPGDTTWVQAHQDTRLEDFGYYDTAVHFPDGSVSYRKIIMTFTLGKYVCPGNPQYCSDWDYTIRVLALPAGGDTLEIGRFFTPYAKGPRMPADWKGVYAFDVSDFYPLLRNQTTIRLSYEGYSGGFTGNIRFAMIEGTRDRDLLQTRKLWHGLYRYGNPAQPITTWVKPVTAQPPAGTDHTEFRLTTTGHGMDNSGCAEFCQRSYQVSVNGTRQASKLIWRDNCGYNYIYPQSGTWIYNRANWCPGDLVLPEKHRLSGITPGQDFELDLTFDPHNSIGANANWMLGGMLLYFGALNKQLDASVEDIIAPTDADRHFRENSRCSHPVIRVKNRGTETIRTLTIRYGVNGHQETHTWEGALASFEETEISLPELWSLREVAGSAGQQQFSVRLLQVNGTEDNDPANNIMHTWFTPAPRWPSELIFSIRTNRAVSNGHSQSAWRIRTPDGGIVFEKNQLAASSQYTDTLKLAPACYILEVDDAGCDGLSWWNSNAGNGTFTARDINGGSLALKGYFGGDFGCGFTQHFSTDWASSVEMPAGVGKKAALSLYPNPVEDRVRVEIQSAGHRTGSIRITDISGRTVYNQVISGHTTEIPLTDLSPGMYQVVYHSEGTGTLRASLLRQP